MLHIPEKIASGEIIPVVAVSGGKDSTAVCLALRDEGIEHRRVFADTGWEHWTTYEHLDMLREKLGPIDVVGVNGGFVSRMRYRAGFASRMARWCTRELKIEPLLKYHNEIRDNEGDTVSVVGIRAAESPRRAEMKEFEDDDGWGGYVWRPILHWPVEAVLAIHHRHGVPVHPLYKAGMSRVGCWPCIFSRKAEIRRIAELDPERIDLIRNLENELTELRAQRNREKPGRYAHATATFFQSIDRKTTNNIDQVVAWSKTKRGGKEVELLAPPPLEGCYRWGMCEAPVPEE